MQLFERGRDIGKQGWIERGDEVFDEVLLKGGGGLIYLGVSFTSGTPLKEHFSNLRFFLVIFYERPQFLVPFFVASPNFAKTK